MATPATTTREHTTDKPPRRRRSIPVSLRVSVAILLLIGTACVYWVGIPAYRRRAAIGEIGRLGGTASITIVDPPRWLPDNLLVCFPSFARVDAVDLDETTADATTMRHIASFPELRKL